MTANKLILNINKSNFVIFHPYQKRLSYQPKLCMFDNEKNKQQLWGTNNWYLCNAILLYLSYRNHEAGFYVSLNLGTWSVYRISLLSKVDITSVISPFNSSPSSQLQWFWSVAFPFSGCNFFFVISFLLQFYLGGNLFLFWFISTSFSSYVLVSSLRRFW